MKLKYKIMICLGLLFLLSLIFLVIVNYDNKEINLLTIKKSYCFVSSIEEKTNFDIDIYTSNICEEIINESRITEAFLTDEFEDEKYLINMESIKATEEKVEYENIEYTRLLFSFMIPVNENNIEISNAYLEINYIDSIIRLNIGSIGVYKVPHYGDQYGNLTISRLKGIVNDYDGEKKLVGIILGIKNHTQYNIIINDIAAYSPSVSLSTTEMIQVNPDVKNTSDISTLLGYEYNLSTESSSIVDKMITKNKEVFYLIPIKYQEIASEIVDSVGIKIVFENDGVLYHDEFKYFSSSVSNDKQISTCTYNEQ